MSIEMDDLVFSMLAEAAMDKVTDHPSLKNRLTDDEYNALTRAVAHAMQEQYRYSNYANDV